MVQQSGLSAATVSAAWAAGSAGKAAGSAGAAESAEFLVAELQKNCRWSIVRLCVLVPRTVDRSHDMV